MTMWKSRYISLYLPTSPYRPTSPYDHVEVAPPLQRGHRAHLVQGDTGRYKEVQGDVGRYREM